jgi:hypothetical protein
MAWLEESAGSKNCAAISYAAVELRFAIERLAIHYWSALLNRDVEEHDLRDIRSFKSVERRIYELGGHQKEINGHFEFTRVVFAALQIDPPCETPKMGEIANRWHTCSEYCHIAWPLASVSPVVQSAAFADLTEVANFLLPYVESFGWPVLKDNALLDLRDGFVSGTVSTQDVLEHIKKIGLYAVEKPASGAAAKFLGTAVPPRETPRG